MIPFTALSTCLKREGEARSIMELKRQVGVRHPSEGMELIDNKPDVLDFC
jgi:hypothetical protein